MPRTTTPKQMAEMAWLTLVPYGFSYLQGDVFDTLMRQGWVQTTFEIPATSSSKVKSHRVRRPVSLPGVPRTAHL